MGPKPRETETENVVELSPNGKAKQKKEKVKERQMFVRRRKPDVLQLEEGEEWYEEVEEYKRQYVLYLFHYSRALKLNDSII
jgi:hypothetical protein